MKNIYHIFMRVFCDPAPASYAFPGHPEAPFRVIKTRERLIAAGLPPEAPPAPATDLDVRRAHTDAHWRAVANGLYHDADTPWNASIPKAAMASLSCALAAMESAENSAPAFSLMRPPGHHAGRERIAGFCYLNNMACACLKALDKGRKVAVLDVDVHHGDGTEDIARRRDNWLVISLHQSPLYPGTGTASRDNCINVPLPPGTDEKRYFTALEPVLARILDFKPDLLGVSAGFDTYKNDPLAQFRFDKITYRRLGRLIADTRLPRFALLEGGYAADVPELIERFVEGFSGA